ncbi:hypothetical protein ACFWTE_06285 [Nocardiopsis sp. NPDC058631]|uniref:hypothetical protein n=1 Tax=Nocardiopsis sp. NPDC058631 TaxID=3346566 RepID=UPI003666B844
MTEPRAEHRGHSDRQAAGPPGGHHPHSPDGRPGPAPVPVSGVEAAAGAPQYDSTTRLSCAAWTDASFRADVLRERQENPSRTLAREPGLDAARVTEECRRARNVRAAAGAWFLGLAVFLLLFNFLAGVTALALSAILGGVARYRAHRGSTARLGCVAWTLILLVGSTVVFAVLGALLEPFTGSGMGADDPFGTSDGFAQDSGDGGTGGLIPSWLAFLLLLAAVVGLGYWVRLRTNTALLAIRAGADRPWKGSGVGTVPVAFYSDFMPFVGAGVPYESWPVTLKLLPAKVVNEHTSPPPEQDGPDGAADAAGTVGEAVRDAGETGPTVAGAALIERLYDRLRTEMPLLTGTEGTLTTTRREVEVADCVFLPGVRQDDITVLAPALIDTGRWALREEWISGFVEAFHERARHFLEIGVSMWESQVVVTVFVRLTTQGGLLRVEGETMVMPPISPGHQVPSGPLPLGSDPAGVAQLLWASLRGVPENLWALPAEALAWNRSRVATNANNKLYAWARAHQDFFDYSPRMGIRARSATTRLDQLFQAHDVRRVTETVPEKVFVCIREVLREAGYSTAQVAQILQNINNNSGNQVFGTQNADGMNFGPGNTTVNKGAGSGGSGGPDRS